MALLPLPSGHIPCTTTADSVTLFRNNTRSGFWLRLAGTPVNDMCGGRYIDIKPYGSKGIECSNKKEKSIASKEN